MSATATATAAFAVVDGDEVARHYTDDNILTSSVTLNKLVAAVVVWFGIRDVTDKLEATTLTLPIGDTAAP